MALRLFRIQKRCFMSHNIGLSQFIERAESYPTRTSMVFNDKKQTYEETYHNSLKIAITLKNQYNVEHGDIIGHLSSFTPFATELFLAAQMLNATLMPICPITYPQSMIDHSFNMFKTHKNGTNTCAGFKYPKITLIGSDPNDANNANSHSTHCLPHNLAETLSNSIENSEFLENFMDNMHCYHSSTDINDIVSEIKEINDYNMQNYDNNELLYINFGNLDTSTHQDVAESVSHQKVSQTEKSPKMVTISMARLNELIENDIIYYKMFECNETFKRICFPFERTNFISIPYTFSALTVGLEIIFHNWNKYGSNIWQTIDDYQCQTVAFVDSYSNLINSQIDWLNNVQPRGLDTSGMESIDTNLDQSTDTGNGGCLDLSGLRRICLAGDRVLHSKLKQLVLNLAGNDENSLDNSNFIKINDDLVICNSYACNEMGAFGESDGLNVRCLYDMMTQYRDSNDDNRRNRGNRGNNSDVSLALPNDTDITEYIESHFDWLTPMPMVSLRGLPLTQISANNANNVHSTNNGNFDTISLLEANYDAIYNVENCFNDNIAASSHVPYFNDKDACHKVLKLDESEAQVWYQTGDVIECGKDSDLTHAYGGMHCKRTNLKYGCFEILMNNKFKVVGRMQDMIYVYAPNSINSNSNSNSNVSYGLGSKKVENNKYHDLLGDKMIRRIFDPMLIEDTIYHEYSSLVDMCVTVPAEMIFENEYSHSYNYRTKLFAFVELKNEFEGFNRCKTYDFDFDKFCSDLNGIFRKEFSEMFDIFGEIKVVKSEGMKSLPSKTVRAVLRARAKEMLVNELKNVL